MYRHKRGIDNRPIRANEKFPGASERYGLDHHQDKATLRGYRTLEECERAYITYWQFVADEMQTLTVSELKEVA